jgi:hypothetical protein
MMAAALVEALPDPLDEIELRRVLCREAGQREYKRGYEAGYLRAVAEIKLVQQQLYTAVQLVARRYSYSTPARTAEEIRAAARASWAPCDRREGVA